jgi:hypothetical protein
VCTSLVAVKVRAATRNPTPRGVHIAHRRENLVAALKVSGSSCEDTRAPVKGADFLRNYQTFCRIDGLALEWSDGGLI